MEVDLTREQFPDGVYIPMGAIRSREYVLSFPETVERYKLLSFNLHKFLPVNCDEK